MTMDTKQSNRFLVRNPEKGDLNQYWYSLPTIEAMVADCLEVGEGSIAFLSTPSIYFSLPEADRKGCKCFDLDTKWEKDPGFVLYDFNKPEDIPKELVGTFSMVVIDPPFVVREVWEKYAEAAKLLLKEGGKVMASTIQENADMMLELLSVRPVVFKPSIPNLVYQYFLYANFDSKELGQPNPEIPED